jgi:hypothetical protein
VGVGADDRPPFHIGLALWGWAWERRSLIEGQVILSGGSRGSLTIRDYCDSAYALLIDDFRRRGISLDESVELLREWAVGVHAEHEERLLEATAGLEAVEQDDERVAMMNNQALDAMGLGLGA